MDDTWWVSADQLDPEQEQAVNRPLIGSYLITGPPGSGKSNLLLLRATQLHLSGRPNFVLLVFTAALRSFLAHGHDYDFPPQRIRTYIGWACELLRENGLIDDLPEGFRDMRNEIAKRLQELVGSRKLRTPWDTILVDEGQDYTSVEIELFFSLAKNVYIVGDSAQSIYLKKPEWLGTAVVYVKEHITLLYNYRNGQKICKVADEVGRGIPGYVDSVPTSRYDESKAPSSVELVTDFPPDNLLDELDSRLSNQLDAYPTGYIGVLVPKLQLIEPTFNLLRLSRVGQQVVRLDHDSREFHRLEKRILLGTIHSAKGFEFRAVHLVGMHDFTRLAQPRKLTLVAITRAKTSLVAYREHPFHEFLEGAFPQSRPTTTLPLAALFPKRKQ